LETSKLDNYASQKEVADQLKTEWKLMWRERYDDRAKAEGVSIANYDALQIERGTIIHATRDYKLLNFKDILAQHKIEHPDRFIEPNPSVGGWGKFIKTEITPKPLVNKYQSKSTTAPKSNRRRGWLHMQ
jgi:hypothetical protein